MDFAQLLQLSLFSQILSSSMDDHDDCVSYRYYFVSLVIAIFLGAVTSYVLTIIYHPALTAASASANDTEANSAPNTGGGHNTGSGSGGRSDATIDQVALVSGTGAGGQATSASGQNSDPITVQAAGGSGQNSDPIAVQAAAGSGLNFDHSTGHVLGSGRSSGVALGSGGRSDASGRSSVATLSFNSVRSTVATLGSGRSSVAALGSGGLSDAALFSDTGSGQNSDFITVLEAAGSGPNSESSTSHALGSDRPSDPTTNDAALVTGTDSGCHPTSDSGPSSGPTTSIVATGSGPSSGPTTVHDASCSTPTRQAAFSKDPTAAFFNAAFFNAAPSSSDSDNEAH